MQPAAGTLCFMSRRSSTLSRQSWRSSCCGRCDAELWLSQTAPREEKFTRRDANHSMWDSTQLMSSGAIIGSIPATRTRPSAQNRHTTARSVEKPGEKLRLELARSDIVFSQTHLH